MKGTTYYVLWGRYDHMIKAQDIYVLSFRHTIVRPYNEKSTLTCTFDKSQYWTVSGELSCQWLFKSTTIVRRFDEMKSDDVLGLTLWKKISTMYCKMQFQNCILRSDYRALSGARRIRWRCYQTKMLPNRSDQGCTNLNKGPIYAIWN